MAVGAEELRAACVYPQCPLLPRTKALHGSDMGLWRAQLRKRFLGIFLLFPEAITVTGLLRASSGDQTYQKWKAVPLRQRPPPFG